jgi:hypothetical protein
MVEEARRAARQLATADLAPELLSLLEEIADFSGNSTLQIRARVLLARIDLEAKHWLARAKATNANL